MARSLDWETFLLTQAGQTCLAWEEGAFARFVSRKSGDRALQIGLWRLNALNQSPIGHRIEATDEVRALCREDSRVLLVAKPNQLPLASDSCDIIVWPHGLDMGQSCPQETLTEIYRVLAPNGLLVTTFFNSKGMWALREKYLHASKLIPNSAARFSTNQVKSLLTRTGLTLEGGNFGVYAVRPQSNPSNIRLPGWIDKAGDRWWPTLSNVVLLCARKNDIGMNLVGKVNFARTKATRTVGAIARKQACHTTK